MQNAPNVPVGKVARKTQDGKLEREARFVPVTPEQVQAVPPWERDECRYHEIPAVLKHHFNFSVRVETVYRWMKTGRAAKDGTGTLYLNHTKKIGRIFVKKADLLRFMELT